MEDNRRGKKKTTKEKVGEHRYHKKIESRIPLNRGNRGDGNRPKTQSVKRKEKGDRLGNIPGFASQTAQTRYNAGRSSAKPASFGKKRILKGVETRQRIDDSGNKSRQGLVKNENRN